MGWLQNNPGAVLALLVVGAFVILSCIASWIT
jgi:hypothetical protein